MFIAKIALYQFMEKLEPTQTTKQSWDAPTIENLSLDETSGGLYFGNDAFSES